VVGAEGPRDVDSQRMVCCASSRPKGTQGIRTPSSQPVMLEGGLSRLVARYGQVQNQMVQGVADGCFTGMDRISPLMTPAI